MKRNAVWLSLIVLQAIVGIGAVAGALWVVPTLPLALLHETFLSGYTIPAMLLLFAVGGSALSAVVALIIWRPESAPYCAVGGGILCGWIVAQILLIGFVHVLQPVLFVTGLVELTLSWLLWRDERRKIAMLRANVANVLSAILSPTRSAAA
jgi:hypothetical protein